MRIQQASFKGIRSTLSILYSPFLNIFEGIERWEWNGMELHREGKPKDSPRLSKLKVGKWHLWGTRPRVQRVNDRAGARTQIPFSKAVPVPLVRTTPNWT